MVQKPEPALWPEVSSESLTQQVPKKFKFMPESPSSSPPTTAHSPTTTTDEDRLKRFARHGGPDLTDIRGYCSPTNTLNTKNESVFGTSGSRDQGDLESIYCLDGRHSFVGTTQSFH
ncbi:hypothetical protein BDV34DRAFT_231059 [Aspergillus parasiticus]|uniref:Uncharacterized protein n=1 Tax=Aspergillus parasiticus TaxID=5067 RepID=A0A5N6D2Z0_ASPPA|nr:hypothetical protein BDV34DRAFT_231059 [Aspergillus parasiticus]